MIKFFMMTRGRTGSSAVMDELNNSSSFLALQEPFIKMNNKPTKIPSIPRFDLWDSNVYKKNAKGKIISFFEREETRASKYLDYAEDMALRQSVQGFGYKVLAHHFSQRPYLSDMLKERKYKSFYLTRNKVRRVLSGITAEMRGRYNVKGHADYKDNNKYKVNIKMLQSRLEQEDDLVEKDIEMLEKECFPYCIVSYEEFLLNRESFYAKIFESLGVQSELPSRTDYKVMINDMSETLSNYEEVCDLVERLGYSWD